jgi:imidazolonepropionase-like amidohydrolase
VRGVRILAAVLASFFLAVTAGVADSPNLALVGGTVIPATGAPPIPDAAVLIENGLIKEVGPRDSVTVPGQYEIVDTEARWITPGLIDTNVHLILMTVPEFFVKYEDRLTDIAVQSAQVGLKYGLTTMADSWGPLEPLLEARDRINRGESDGSRILVAGNIVGLGGPYSSYFMGSWDVRGLTLRYGGWVHPMIQQRINALWEDDVGPALLAMTPEEAAEAIRSYIAKGVDFVKVAVSGHGIGPVEPMLFSEAVLHAMREEVRKAGIPFQTHTFSVESLRVGVELEPELLQHPNVMSIPWKRASEAQKAATRAMIAEIAKKGVYSALMAIPHKEQMRIYSEWDPAEHPEEPFLNQIMANRKLWILGSTFEERAEAVRIWLDAGVRFTLATDQGPEAPDLGPVVWGRLGRAHFDRMEALQEIGATPMEILIAATRNGAEAYGLGENLGTVEAGKQADLLVLAADPLADISNLRKIQQVIQQGRLIDRATLPTVRVLDYDPEAPWPY